MIQLNELSPYGYGMMLYSPDVLADFLKAKKCWARKLCSYFDKNKSVFYKAIENGVALPIYPITIAKYAIFVSINEAETNAPEGWEQICKYDDFIIQVGNSNKLCWSSFDYFEHSKEPLDKRPSADCKIHQHGPEAMSSI